MPVNLPSWAWLIGAGAALLLYLYRARKWPFSPPDGSELALLRDENRRLKQAMSESPVSSDPQMELQHEIIRGILRKEGILAEKPATNEGQVFEFRQRFKLERMEDVKG